MQEAHHVSRQRRAERQQPPDLANYRRIDFGQHHRSDCPFHPIRVHEQRHRDYRHFRQPVCGRAQRHRTVFGVYFGHCRHHQTKRPNQNQYAPDSVFVPAGGRDCQPGLPQHAHAGGQFRNRCETAARHCRSAENATDELGGQSVRLADQRELHRHFDVGDSAGHRPAPRVTRHPPAF